MNAGALNIRIVDITYIPRRSKQKANTYTCKLWGMWSYVSILRHSCSLSDKSDDKTGQWQGVKKVWCHVTSDQ